MIQLVFYFGLLVSWLPALRAYSADDQIVAADAEIFREPDLRNSIFNTDFVMAFPTAEMNMIVGMFFGTAGVAAFRKINNAVDIRDFMDVVFLFQAFPESGRSFPVA